MLVAGISVVCVLANKRWRKLLVISVFISLLSIGWYGKNYVKFGFFGSSSWSGLGLWNIAAAYYAEEQLEALVKENVIERIVVDVLAFSRPSEYLEYGFNTVSDVAVLSRNDYNNTNIVAISRLYHGMCQAL